VSILTKKRIFLIPLFLGFSILFVFSVFGSFLFFSPGKARVNLLILGEAGEGCKGASLTDTIMFASVSKGSMVLLSVPRDIWYSPLKTKINSLYFYGGFPKLEEALRGILGQDIDASVLVDFGTFIKIIDFFGGVDIYVDGAFDDFRYPIPGKEEDLCGGDKTFACRYEHIHFDSGWQHMNGETALKFARSRQSNGDEGTDYARSRRQQKVIVALKNKIFSPWFLRKPEDVFTFWRLLSQGLKTNLRVGDLLSLAKFISSLPSLRVKTFVLDGWETDEGYLYHPKKHSSGQWVLLPHGDRWSEIHQFVNSIL